MIKFGFSNVDRLRDFIKHVYVEKRYAADRGGDKPPRGKMVGVPWWIMVGKLF